MATALSSPSAAVRAQTLRTINALRLEGFDDALASVAHDQDATDGLRIEALRALARGQSALDDDAFAILFRQLSRTNNALGRLTAAEISGGSRLNAGQFARFVEAVDGDPMISPALVLAALPRAGRDLIESMVMPSATFVQGYETYSVTLRNGDTLTGIRVSLADDSLVLRDASGAQTRIASDQATRIERQKLSLMPEGLLNALNESEIRDLLAYLQSLK